VEELSPLTGATMRLSVRLIELRRGTLRYQLAPGLPGDPTADIKKTLQGLTGQMWLVERLDGEAAAGAQPSLVEATGPRSRGGGRDAGRSLVRAALEAFPGAEILDESNPATAERRPWRLRGADKHEVHGRNDPGCPEGRRNDPEADGGCPGRLDAIEVEGAAGGGLVKIKASAKGRVIGVAIDDSLLVPADKGILEDLVAAAFNDARAKADAAAGEEMQKVQMAAGIPPGFKLPF
jgi:DNA-binding YbaB/EbfC family protein